LVGHFFSFLDFSLSMPWWFLQIFPIHFKLIFSRLYCLHCIKSVEIISYVISQCCGLNKCLQAPMC
jgi:hypothetical protein